MCILAAPIPREYRYFHRESACLCFHVRVRTGGSRFSPTPLHNTRLHRVGHVYPSINVYGYTCTFAFTIRDSRRQKSVLRDGESREQHQCNDTVVVVPLVCHSFFVYTGWCLFDKFCSLDFNSKARRKKETEINYFFRFESLQFDFECLILVFARFWWREVFQGFVVIFFSGWYTCLFDKVLMDFK